METDGRGDEIEMCKILDELSALSQGVLDYFCPVHPWKKRVFSAKIVAVHIDEGEKTIDKFVKDTVSLLGNIVLCFAVARNS